MERALENRKNPFAVDHIYRDVVNAGGQCMDMANACADAAKRGVDTYNAELLTQALQMLDYIGQYFSKLVLLLVDHRRTMHGDHVTYEEIADRCIKTPAEYELDLDLTTVRIRWPKGEGWTEWHEAPRKERVPIDWDRLMDLFHERSERQYQTNQILHAFDRLEELQEYINNHYAALQASKKAEAEKRKENPA